MRPRLLTYHVNYNIGRIDNFIQLIPDSLAKDTLTRNQQRLQMHTTFALSRRLLLSPWKAFLLLVQLHLLVLRFPKSR